MKSKYPLEFSTTEDDIAAWHGQEADAAENDGQWAAAIFHLDYLRIHTPQDPTVTNRLAEAHRKLAPDGE